MEELIKYIKLIAYQELIQDSEDFDPQDFSGGNYDDAFNMGERDGTIIFARELASKFNL